MKPEQPDRATAQRPGAEPLLAERRSTVGCDDAAERQRLLHELEVRQLELELRTEELRLTRQDLEVAQARRFALDDLAPVGYASLSEHGLILEANLTLSVLLGVGKDRLLGQPFPQYVHPEDRDTCHRHWPRVADGSVRQECEVRLIRHDGSAFWADLVATRSPGDEVVEPVILMVVSDIGERKRADQALLLSEQKYRRLHETMTDAFALVGLAGHIRECNRAFCEMLGYTAAELYELTYRDLTPPEWHAFEADIVQQQVLIHGSSSVYEKEYRRKDGTVFPVELHTFLLRDDAGQPAAMWAIVRDVTVRKQTERALQAREAAAREFSARLQALHQLRDELSTAPTVDALCRRAVEAGRSRLGFDRLSLWLLDSAEEFFTGTFGVDEHGQITDQRELRYPYRPGSVEDQVIKSRAAMLLRDDTELWTAGVLLARGMHAMATLSDGHHALGYLATDDLLRPGRISEQQGELLALYAAALGHLIARVRRETELREKHDLLAQIMETSPAGIITVDRDGRITAANARAEHLLGVSRDAITEREYNAPEWEITDFDGRPFPDQDLPFRRVVATGEPVHGVCHAISWADGRRVLLAINAAPLRGPDGEITAVVTAFDDVTESDHTKRLLRDQLALQKAWLDAVPLPVYYTDLDDRIAGCNRAFAELAGRPQNQLLGVEAKQFVPSDAAHEAREWERLTLGRGEPVRSMVVMPSTTGAGVFWIHKASYCDSAGQVAGLVATAVDVTERERLFEELNSARSSLRALASELTLAEEQERRRLAVEVHDGLGQTLAVLQLRLAALQHALADHPARPTVADVRQLVASATVEVRGLAARLSPVVLYEFGLEAAVRQLAKETEVRFELSITMQFDGSIAELPGPTQLTLYQFLREILHNAVKHARASRVEVHLSATRSALRLTVEDDGVGPPAQILAGQLPATAGLGLFSIRERAEHLGGQLRIGRGAGGGTIVAVELPAWCKQAESEGLEP